MTPWVSSLMIKLYCGQRTSTLKSVTNELTASKLTSKLSKKMLCLMNCTKKPFYSTSLNCTSLAPKNHKFPRYPSLRATRPQAATEHTSKNGRRRPMLICFVFQINLFSCGSRTMQNCSSTQVRSESSTFHIKTHKTFVCTKCQRLIILTLMLMTSLNALNMHRKF
jgi:hypothetical protein